MCVSQRTISIESLEEDLLCPITLELPEDPVMAMDGRVYERRAIEMHFATQTDEIKSPMTRETISPHLIAATQHKKMIEIAIKNGLVSQEVADAWEEKKNEKKYREQLQKMAEHGDMVSMQVLSYNYMTGSEGFPQDMNLAFKWAKKAHKSDSVMGTATMGWMMIHGLGTRKNRKKGIRRLKEAAVSGSAWASCRLGLALADGLYGLPKNHLLASHWLEMTVNGSSKFDDCRDAGKVKAQEKLDEIRSCSA